MNTSFRERSVVLVAGFAILSGVACSSSKDDKSSAMAAIASGSLAVKAPVLPSAAPPPAPEKPIIRRARDASDLLVSPERRARAESLAPEAKGFLVSADIEQQLYALNLKRGKDSDAVKAFDRIAKGKWVLFTGNIGNPTEASFELPVRYTPQDPNDAMGITAVWISVKLTNVKGYDAKEYRPGELAVVLAKYEGKLAAPAGYDVVLLEHWF